MLCSRRETSATPHNTTPHNTMTNTTFLDQELTLDHLKTINGGGLPGWVIRAWKKWINDESDDVVNSLTELNKLAKNNTNNDRMEEN